MWKNKKPALLFALLIIFGSVLFVASKSPRTSIIYGGLVRS